MTWIKLDDGFPDHPKVLGAGEDAAWLFVSSLCYAGKHLTDGLIPDAALVKLTTKRRPAALADRLVDVGLWERVDGGWRIHEYVEVQRTKGQVEAARERARERQSRKRHAVTLREQEDASRRDIGVSHANGHDEVRLPESREEEEKRSNPFAQPLPEIAGPPRSRSSAEPTEPEGFSLWWAAYPRKVSRKPAVDKYRIALRKVSAEDLFVALKRHVQAWQADGTEMRMIPHPSAWLHQERWNDELGGTVDPEDEFLRSDLARGR